MRRGQWLACALFLVGSSATALPNQLALQGVFKNQAGDPIPSGQYDVRFSIHTESSASDTSEELWNVQLLQLEVGNGVITHTLGSVSPLPGGVFAQHAELWLELKIASEPPLPRVPFRSVAWALHAGSADALVCSGCVGELQLAQSVKDQLGALQTAVEGIDETVADDLAAHAANADAHHSSTSDGLAITPLAVFIKDTDIKLDSAGLTLAVGDAGELTADKLAKLVGGSDVLADDLHTHVSDSSAAGGGCYTAMGTSSCGSGYTSMYAGTLSFPYVAQVNGSATFGGVGSVVCLASWTHTTNMSASAGFWGNANEIDHTAKSCALCCASADSTLPGAAPGCTSTLNLGQSGYGKTMNNWTSEVGINLGYASFDYHLGRINFMVRNDGSWANNQIPNARLVFLKAGQELANVSLKTTSDSISSNGQVFIEMEGVIDLDLAGGQYQAKVVNLAGNNWNIWATNSGTPFYKLFGCLNDN